MGITLRFRDDDEREKGDGAVYECEKRPLTSDEVLAILVGHCRCALDEIETSAREGYEINDYAEGIKSAYVEILQILQEWEKKGEYGLNIDIEKVYPVR